MTKFEIAGADYGREESLHLRETMIELRNGALEQEDFGWAVTLSHVVAWMQYAIDHTWPTNEA